MSLPPLPSSTTVDLEQHPCTLCCGEGFLVLTGGPGRFDDLLECWMPDEDIEPCPDCRATGEAYTVRLVSPRSVPQEPAVGHEDDLPF